MARTTAKTERFELRITAKPGQLKGLTEKLTAEGIDLSAAVSEAVGFKCEATLDRPEPRPLADRPAEKAIRDKSPEPRPDPSKDRLPIQKNRGTDDS